MRPRPGPRWVLLVVLLVLAAPRTAAAHTEVLRAEPQPGTEVAGPVDRVGLTFLDPVQPGTAISVSDDAGRPVAGLGAVEEGADRRSATVRFDPLTEPGGYVVAYRFTAEDGDEQAESYRFTLGTPGAPAPAAAEDDGPDVDDARVAAAGVFGVALGACVVVALLRRSRHRSGATPSDPS